MATCKVCDSTSAAFGEATVLGKYTVRYFQCVRCGFVQTEEPFWLAEAYSTALIAADVGAVQRNLLLAETTQAIVERFFDPAGRFLDYGGGYGLFVRLMRDRGLDFRWRDKYAANLYGMGFEADAGSEGFDLVTAFEVFEHLVDPVAEVGEMLRQGAALLFSTELIPAANPRPGAWWYYAPFGGQHIALYTRAALAALGARFGAHLTTSGRSLHLLSARRVSALTFRWLSRVRVARAFNALRRRRSLIPEDQELLSASGAQSGLRATGDRAAARHTAWIDEARSGEAGAWVRRVRPT